MKWNDHLLLKAFDDTKSVNLTVTGFIGLYFTASDFISYMDYIKEHYPDFTVNVSIYSGGGYYLDGLAVYEYAQVNDIVMNVKIYGLCGSAATFLPCASNNVEISENSEYFVHRAQPVDTSDPPPQEEIDKANNTIVSIYRAKTGLSKNAINKLLDAGDEGKTISAKEALEYGFVDNIIKTSSKKKISNNIIKHSLAAYKAAGFFNDKPSQSNNNNNIMTSEEKFKGILNAISNALGITTTEGNEESEIANKLTELVNAVNDAKPVNASTLKSEIVNDLKTSLTASFTDVAKGLDQSSLINDLKTKLEEQETRFTKLSNDFADNVSGKGGAARTASDPASGEKTMEGIDKLIENAFSKEKAAGATSKFKII